jgi:hypothetical protein
LNSAIQSAAHNGKLLAGDVSHCKQIFGRGREHDPDALGMTSPLFKKRFFKSPLQHFFTPIAL